MEEEKQPLETLLHHAEEYGKVSIELLKLKAIDRSANLASSLASNIIVVVPLLLFFLLLNIGVALWAGELLGRIFYGFFAVAGFYAVVGGILYLFKNTILKTPINNSIVNQALNHT